MKIYLSNPYGTIPGEDWREYRFFLLAKALVSEGHEVVWFTSTFSHHFKKQRSKESKVISISNNLTIHLIKSRPYKRNFSFGRILRDLTYGYHLMHVLKKDYSKPDIFFIGDSPVLFYYPSYWYCSFNKIPYIVDQMDLWPELIVNSFPKVFQSIINLLCFPIYRVRRSLYDNSYAFMSLAQKYLDIPMSISKGIREKPHVVIYNGIDVDAFREQMTTTNETVDKMLGVKNSGEVWFIFAGTLGPSYDIKIMLEGFLKLSNDNCKLIIAGDGSERGYVEKFIEDNKPKNIKYIGKVSKNLLPYLYSKCDVGLNSYGQYSNVEMSDKFYDYSAAGLVIINSLKGEVMEFVDGFEIGYNYKASNIESFMQAIDKVLRCDNLNELKKNSFALGSRFDQNVQMLVFKEFMFSVTISLTNRLGN